MMPVDVTARVCPLNVRAGLTLIGDWEADAGCSAGIMEREKSILEVRMTLDDGKKLSEVMVLRCGLLVV